MTDEKIKENAERFDELLRETGRDGIGEMIRRMHDSGFYTAPASTIYHLSEPGGLLKHSLNVWDCFSEMGKAEFYSSAIICCLLHDLCKIDLYTPVDGGYRYNKEVGDLGHGTRSVGLIQQFIELTPEEEEAIRYHMGLWDCDDRRAVGDVYRRNELAWMLHMADEAATFIVEK